MSTPKNIDEEVLVVDVLVPMTANERRLSEAVRIETVSDIVAYLYRIADSYGGINASAVICDLASTIARGDWKNK